MKLEERQIRYGQMKVLRDAGHTLLEIGNVFGISEQGSGHILRGGMPNKNSGKPKNPFWEARPKWQQEGRDRTRELVRFRDGYTCQNKKCGRVWQSDERRFDVHHKDGMCGKKSRGYDVKNDLEKLTTFCHKCHMGLHVGKDKFKSGKLASISAETIRFKHWSGESYDAIGRELGVSFAAVYNKANPKT